MTDHIVLCGLNGSGKSTLGRALAEISGYVFRDIEDYYFQKQNSYYIYDNPRTTEEVQKMILNDFNKFDNFVFAAVKGNYNNEISDSFTHAVFICVPKEIRIKRMDKAIELIGED